MPRVVSVFLPSWPTDRLMRKQATELRPSTGLLIDRLSVKGARPVEEQLGAAAGAGTSMPPAARSADGSEAPVPLILTSRSGSRRDVYALNAAARACGLNVGIPATKAQALVPDLIIRDAEPAADDAGLQKLALWALQRYSPVVAADPPDGLVVDTTGAAHLQGFEAAMLEDIVNRLAAVGVTARAALAGTWGSARAFARYAAGASRPCIVLPVGQGAQQLMRLPITALRLPAGMVAGLRKLGFDRIAINAGSFTCTGGNVAGIAVPIIGNSTFRAMIAAQVPAFGASPNLAQLLGNSNGSNGSGVKFELDASSLYGFFGNAYGSTPDSQGYLNGAPEAWKIYTL